MPIVARLATIDNRKHWVVAISDPRLSIVKIVFDCRISGVETETCKLLLVALVSDYFGYVFSRPIFNEGGNRKVNTNDERRSKIVRNRVFDCRLSPDC